MGFSRFPSQLFGVASAQLPSIHGGATFFYTSKVTLYPETGRWEF